MVTLKRRREGPYANTEKESGREERERNQVVIYSSSNPSPPVPAKKSTSRTRYYIN